MFLLDTNVVSELRKAKAGRADKNVVAWAACAAASSMFVSAITVQELEIGVLLAARRDPAQGAILRRWLEAQVLPAFVERILPADTAVASLAPAQRHLGTKTKRDTINHALVVAAGTNGEDRARGLAWLQDNAAEYLDFEALDEYERSRR
jgi:predicted nucleic acid-binding protein